MLFYIFPNYDRFTTLHESLSNQFAAFIAVLEHLSKWYKLFITITEPRLKVNNWSTAGIKTISKQCAWSTALQDSLQSQHNLFLKVSLSSSEHDESFTSSHKFRLQVFNGTKPALEPKSSQLEAFYTVYESSYIVSAFILIILISLFLIISIFIFIFL